MAARNGVVPGGESGVLEMNSPPNPSGGSPYRDLQSVRVSVPEMNVAEEEIVNLLRISGSAVHSVALQEWERKLPLLKSWVDDMEKQCADLMKQIVNFVWFFIVFQGVVLTAVAQLKASSEPLCGIVWVPALLSSVAAVVTILGISSNFSTLHGLQISLHNERVSLQTLAGRIMKLRALGRDFDFSIHAQEARRREHITLLSSRQIWILVLLLFVTGLFILSYVVILCNSFTVRKWNQHLQ